MPTHAHWTAPIFVRTGAEDYRRRRRKLRSVVTDLARCACRSGRVWAMKDRPRLEIPAVRTGPTLRGQLALEIDLTLAQVGGIVEAFGVLGTVGIDDAQLVTAGALGDFVS